jgi:hypothetical protein
MEEVTRLPQISVPGSEGTLHHPRGWNSSLPSIAARRPEPLAATSEPACGPVHSRGRSERAQCPSAAPRDGGIPSTVAELVGHGKAIRKGAEGAFCALGALIGLGSVLRLYLERRAPWRRISFRDH